MVRTSTPSSRRCVAKECLKVCAQARVVRAIGRSGGQKPQPGRCNASGFSRRGCGCEGLPASSDAVQSRGLLSAALGAPTPKAGLGLGSRESPFSPHAAIRCKRRGPRSVPERRRQPQEDAAVGHTPRPPPPPSAWAEEDEERKSTARLAPLKTSWSTRAGSGLPRSGFVQSPDGEEHVRRGVDRDAPGAGPDVPERPEHEGRRLRLRLGLPTRGRALRRHEPAPGSAEPEPKSAQQKLSRRP